MSLSETEVRYVAKLGALELKDAEVEKMIKELNDILSYVDQLEAVSTVGVEQTSHVHGSVNAFRDDIIQPSLDQKAIEQNAPDFRDGFFRVPKIIG